MAHREYDHDPGDDKTVTVLMWKLTQRQWNKIVNTIDDPQEMSKTYRQWLSAEKQQREKCLEKGYKIVDVKFSIKEAIAWCQKTRHPVTMKSFLRYSLKKGAAGR